MPQVVDPQPIVSPERLTPIARLGPPPPAHEYRGGGQTVGCGHSGPGAEMQCWRNLYWYETNQGAGSTAYVWAGVNVG